MEARKQGQPSRSKLDMHEAFILGLIEEVPDITLAEMGERLAGERGVRVGLSTVWLFLDRRGITFKKRRRTPQRSNVPMSCAATWTGSTANSILIPRSSSSSMKPRHRWSPVPHGHWKTTTFTAGLRLRHGVADAA